MLPVAIIVALIGLAGTIVSTGPLYITAIESQHKASIQYSEKYTPIPTRINPLKK